MRGARAALVATLMLPFVARAQPATPDPADTLLTLDQTGSAPLVPDRLQAELSLAAQDPDPAAAQQALDRRAAAALAVIRDAAGVEAKAGGYAVVEQPAAPGAEGKAPVWRASQSTTLSATDAPALLSLLGKLQARGMTLDHLAWTSDDADQAAARRLATTQALAALKDEADTAAGALGLKVLRYRTLFVGPVGPLPAPVPMMRSFAAAAVTPLGDADAGRVTVRVSGTAVLGPDGPVPRSP